MKTTVYCTCKWSIDEECLRISFYEASYYKSLYMVRDSDIFVRIVNISYVAAADYLKREIKKQNVRGTLVGETKYKFEYNIRGDIALNFHKMKILIGELNSHNGL